MARRRDRTEADETPTPAPPEAAAADARPEGEVEAANEPPAPENAAPEPQPEPEKPPRWRRRKDARPDELVAAALELFVEQGFAATKLKDVAKRAGVSKGTVYLYFKNKEDLLRSAVQDSIVPIVDLVDELEVDSEGTAEVLLRELMMRWYREFESRGVAGVPKLVMAEAGNFPELAQYYAGSVLQRSRRLFIRILKRGTRDGEFRPMDARAAVHTLTAPLFWAQIHAASFGPYDPSPLDPEARLVAHLDLFLDAIRAPAPGSKS